MTKWNKYLLTLFLISLLPPVTAQETRGVKSRSALENGYYIGVQGGVPFGVSTFSSFGAGKTRTGVDVGIYGGYRFSPVLSVELSMKWGKTAVSAQDCCIEAGYRLGRDGNQYNVPVADMDSWNYADLKSGVSLQSYGAQLNVNLLGFFKSTQRSRWMLEVSPLLKSVNTRYSLRRAEVIKTWLTKHGIDADRIRTDGRGSDYNATDAAKARRADTTHHNPKEEIQR